MGMEMMRLVELRTIHKDNYEECLRLKATVENDDFVDTVTYSLAEAWVYYEDMKPFAIYAHEQMIGFVSMYVGEANYQIINFFIDDAYQQKGLGTAAAKICIRYLQETYHAKRISVPVFLENKAAQKFWSKLNFQFSDTIENGYVFMRLHIA